MTRALLLWASMVLVRSGLPSLHPDVAPCRTPVPGCVVTLTR